jgi:hypothetical protein
VSNAVITLASGKATYKLPAAFAGREIQVLGEQAELTLATVASISVNLYGNGTLKLPEAVTSANIKGAGNVEFTGNIGLTAADSITAGSITFDGTVALPNGAVTLNGDVVLEDTKTITSHSSGGSINLDGSIAVKKTTSSPVKGSRNGWQAGSAYGGSRSEAHRSGGNNGGKSHPGEAHAERSTPHRHERDARCIRRTGSRRQTHHGYGGRRRACRKR